VLDTVILAIATALAAVGVGGLIVEGVRAARADGGRRFSAVSDGLLFGRLA